jgi:nucleoside-diphosphate-sugar epimerase
MNGESFNVVGVNPAIEEIADAVHRELPETKIEKLPPRENEDSFEMDGGKLKRIIKYAQQETLNAGIEGIISKYNAAKR